MLSVLWRHMPPKHWEHQYWYIGTRYVILAKHWMWLPDDDLCEPTYDGAAFIILTIFNNLRIL